MLTRTPCREGARGGLTPPRASQQEYADFLTKMTGIYKESAQKVTNKDVKTAFIDVLDDLDKLIGLLNTDEKRERVTRL